MSRLRGASLSTVAAVTAVALAFAAEWLHAFGPAVLSGHWTGPLLRFALWGGALGITAFGSLRYGDSWLTFLGSFAALGVALFGIQAFVTGWALAERGEIASCTVVSVDRRVETRTDADGDPETRVYYDHRLDCDTPAVRVLTTGGEPAGEPRQRIQVRYDPDGRIHPRPAADVLDPEAMLWLCGAGLGVAVVLRGAAELRGVDPFPGPSPARVVTILYAAGVLWLVVFAAALHWSGRAATTLLDRYGVQAPAPARWAATAALAAVTAVACRRFVLWLLARCPRLDPDGTLRELVALDGLLSGTARGVLTGWMRRRRRRRRRR